MSIFWQNNQFVGLDISDLSLKIVQLVKNGDKIKVQAAGKINLTPGIIEKGEIKDRVGLIKNIRQLFAHPDYGKVTTDEVATCLPETKTFLKIIEVDKDAPDFLAAVNEEAEKHIPFSIKEVYFDWQIIKETIRTKVVLIGATPKDLADQYINILKEAKLITVVLENEPLSVCRCLLEEENIKYKGENKKNYAIIDIGATAASLTVYAKNTILFSVSMPVSGEDITQKIAVEMKIEPSRAEKAKIIYSLQEKNEQPAIKKIVTKMIDELILKSREAINFFNNHFSSWGSIDQIILCGGGANIKNIEKTIGKELEITTVRGNALINLGGKKEPCAKAFYETLSFCADFTKNETNKKNKTLKISQETTLNYATAIGLSLRGIFNQN
ncbi:MAG: type IV pilus assembly protein PilM [Patescibacteria group bacterium]|jgi:type IV pilus assembly protein PilM